MPKKKQGPFSDVEIFYIENNPDELDVAEMAVKINRPIAQVRKIMEDAAPDPNASLKEREEHVTTTRAGKSLMRQMMGKHTRNSKVTSTIMTPAASELADVTKPTRKKMSEEIEKNIHRPYDD